MTHAAETSEEHRFVAYGDGPQADFLHRIGVWDEQSLSEVGAGRSPIEHLSKIMRDAPMIIAHANDLSDRDVGILASSQATVAYCPRASRYFRQHLTFGPHRYRELLAAGVSVALGTDSIVNLPSEQADRLSTLDDARLLVREDGLECGVALGMATWRGGVALGLRREGFSLAAVAEARTLYGLSVVACGDVDKEITDPAERVMASAHLPVLMRPDDGSGYLLA